MSGYSNKSNKCLCVMSMLSIFVVLLGIGISVLISELQFEDNNINFDYNEIPCMEIHSSFKLFEEEVSGAESMAYVGDGKIISGMADGRVMELDIYKNTAKTLYKLKNSRPLGIKLINRTILGIADGKLGFYFYNLETKQREFFIKEGDFIDNLPVLFLDDFAYSPKRNMLYISQVSVKFSFNDDVSLIMHGGLNGRILTYDLSAKKVSALAPKFAFPNGIEIDKDEKYLFVNEFQRFTTHKYDLNTNTLSKFAVFSGHPDNIRSDGFDGFWIAMYSANKRNLYYLEKYPIVRFIVYQLLEFKLMPRRALITPYGSFVHVNEFGEIDKCFYSSDGKAFNQVSEVFQYNGMLFIGSFYDKVDYIAQIKDFS